MAKSVELRRHTDNDGDVLTAEGIETAVDIGRRLKGDYVAIISSGAQRATQAAACLLAGMGRIVPDGVRVDFRFRSDFEDRWKQAYERSGKGDLRSFAEADPEFVSDESARFASAASDLLDGLSEGETALVVGHSPMLEAAAFGLTGEVVAPLSKGAAVVIVQDGTTYRLAPDPLGS
ncbi:MAG: histidine phosphatase family protein [Gaiellales bacterium]